MSHDSQLTDPYERRVWQDEQIDTDEERADFEEGDEYGDD